MHLLSDNDQNEMWSKIYQKSLELFGRLTAQVLVFDKRAVCQSFAVRLGDQRRGCVGALQRPVSAEEGRHVCRLGHEGKPVNIARLSGRQRP